MTKPVPAAVALALAAAALLATPAPSSAAPPRAVISQNRAALSGIAGARRRNNAVINSVQRNIRSSQRRRY